MVAREYTTLKVNQTVNTYLLESIFIFLLPDAARNSKRQPVTTEGHTAGGIVGVLCENPPIQMTAKISVRFAKCYFLA